MSRFYKQDTGQNNAAAAISPIIDVLRQNKPLRGIAAMATIPAFQRNTRGDGYRITRSIFNSEAIVNDDFSAAEAYLSDFRLFLLCFIAYINEAAVSTGRQRIAHSTARPRHVYFAT